MSKWFSPDPSRPQWQVCLTDQNDGNQSFRWGEESGVRSARQALFDTLEIDPSRVMSLSLDVSYGVRWVPVRPPGYSVLEAKGFPAEGIWTPDARIIPFLFVGDCFPIAAYDPDNHLIGMFHAGRPELQAGLLEQWLQLGQQHGVSFRDLRLFIGPGICKQHYVFSELPKHLPEKFQAFIETVGREHHVDLLKYLKTEFQTTGIRSTHLWMDGRCTYESPELFSHRREKGEKEGRFALLTKIASSS